MSDCSSDNNTKENYIADLTLKNAPVAIVGFCPNTNRQVEDNWFDNADMTPKNAKQLYGDEDWTSMYVLNEPFRSINEAEEDKEALNKGLQKVKEYIGENTPTLVVLVGTRIPLHLFGCSHCKPGYIEYEQLPSAAKRWVGKETGFYILPTTISGAPTSYLTEAIVEAVSDAAFYNLKRLI
ncbi:hypothetical protein HMPREF1544_12161 [Mucor circinelloides 1006PhL]|uniref:Uncharacterized protein n=1 Tax=Mucor circinelloides f. circinelloides (strain 1006PhL) TaxID=1220926 RepID=S2IV19_MUCC1|nr:hypothetical protein HMPREF1544_12161 [Mucor circinelloides 1006PhL]